MPLSKIREKAKKARALLDKIKTYKSNKKPFSGSLGVGISSIRKRKKRMAELDAELKDHHD